MSSERLILLDPHPRTINLIFSPEDRRRLEALGKVVCYDGPPATDEHIDRHLPQTVALIGQTAMPARRLEQAPHLRAIFNVEGNFLPNIDYDVCHQRNISVLSCAPAFAPAVAEMALGMALACARGIAEGDRDFRAANEAYGGASNKQAFLLQRKTFGVVGCGNVGRRLIPLLRPFGGQILVHDPWIHNHALEDLGVEPCPLSDLFARSRVVFITATATAQNQAAIGTAHFQAMPANSIVVLVSRAQVVDFPALLAAAESGHICAAVDVFPEEPVRHDDPVRRSANTLLSAHRAGGLPETYREVGRMVADDLEQILAGLPPQRMQPVRIETVKSYKSRPIQ